ncbi:MAG: hypothetical protein OEY85_00830 [Rhodospirillales bacterium]|nr:hypothetical protein [Rhodospirillales bacterium]
MQKDDSLNMKLIGHNTLEGFGGIGEGMAIQDTRDGRRIMWLAHEGPPKNFTGVDVTDPRKPKVIIQTELPHKNVRSNSLEVTGDILAVAYQTMGPAGVTEPGLGLTPAGIELFDITDPENPKTISFFDCSGPSSMGVHQLWFVDGEYIHFAGGAADFIPRNPKDCQFYRSIDVRDPSKPKEVGRWWMPGTREGDSEDPPERHPQFDNGFRAHNTNVYPERPDRAYVGYLDGGTFILDISDKANPKMVGSWNPHPPFPGFTHTVLPLFDRDLIIATDECVRDGGQDWPKLTWVLDARKEDNLVPISTFPLPPVEDFGRRGGRYGSHNLHENRPGPAFRSSTIIFATYFNGGVRVFDTSNPFRPEEIAHFVPKAPEGSRAGAIQINDVYVDENQIVYAVDRFSGGLYILEVDI